MSNDTKVKSTEPTKEEMAKKTDKKLGTPIRKVGSPNVQKPAHIVGLLISHPDGMVQSGRSGSVVHQKNGVRRNFREPTLRQTAATGLVRGNFGAANSAFTSLTQAQQKAWNNAGYTTTNRVGDRKPLSGKSAYTQVNTNLEQTGQTPINDPPVTNLPALPILDGVLTADNSAHTLSLAYTPNVAAGEVLVMATSPQKASIFKPKKGAFKVIGVFDGTAASPANLTAEYDAVFGTNAVAGTGKKIFILLTTITATGNASSKVGYDTIIVA